MERKSKINLLSYGALSAFFFILFVLPENAGISISIFIVFQFIYLYNILENKKGLWTFFPILILSLNSFLYGNRMFQISNFFVILFLYSVMALITMDRFPIKKASMEFLIRIVQMIFKPLAYFPTPFKWAGEINRENTKITKKILMGILICIPIILFLIILLSSADDIFSRSIFNTIRFVFNIIKFDFIFKIVYGCFIGLYLFALCYIIYLNSEEEQDDVSIKINGDFIIINMIFISVLVIYTFFLAIQFKYLFAGSTLPYGLTYSSYARKGFFELLFLSGVNIALILMAANFTKEKTGVWAKITKGLNGYLCAVTIILLVSSFYRMWLYCSDHGYTRLRLLVIGFLIFEALGLLFTFFYILKPKFNIAGIYFIIALSYYLLINLVPIDAIIAKNQIDRYFNQQKYGLEYVFTLSTDAAPQIKRLLSEQNQNEEIKEKAKVYFENIENYYGNLPWSWQSYNRSVSSARKLNLIS